MRSGMSLSRYSLSMHSMTARTQQNCDHWSRVGLAQACLEECNMPADLCFALSRIKTGCNTTGTTVFKPVARAWLEVTSTGSVPPAREEQTAEPVVLVRKHSSAWAGTHGNSTKCFRVQCSSVWCER